MNKFLIYITLCLGLLFLAACTSEGSSDPLQDITWQWESVTTKSTGETTTVPDPENYTLIFKADDTRNRRRGGTHGV